MTSPSDELRQAAQHIRDVAELVAKMFDRSAETFEGLAWPHPEKTFAEELALARAINAKGGAV